MSSAKRHVEARGARAKIADDLDDDQHEEDRAEADEAPDDRQVGRGARQQLARLPAVVEADVEALQVRVEVVAQRGLELGRDGGEQEAPTEGEHDLEQREARRRARHQRHDAGAVAVVQRAVDDRLDDQRQRDLRARLEHRGRDDDREVPAVRPQIRQDPQQGAIAPTPLPQHLLILPEFGPRPGLVFADGGCRVDDGRPEMARRPANHPTEGRIMDWKLELVAVPVTDVDPRSRSTSSRSDSTPITTTV